MPRLRQDPKSHGNSLEGLDDEIRYVRALAAAQQAVQSLPDGPLDPSDPKLAPLLVARHRRGGRIAPAVT